MRTVRAIRTLITALMISIICFGFALPVNAAYRTSFQSPQIEIVSNNGPNCDGQLDLSGVTKLKLVWSCVRGPAGEIETYPAKVDQGYFSLSIPLRFGPGTYTIWAGDNPEKFDGSVRFEVNNSSADQRYSTFSNYVDCQNQNVLLLAEQIVKQEISQREKLKAIHDWVIDNIEYDWEANQSGENKMTSASATLMKKRGMCRDYSFVVAALARATGLPARVVYGEVIEQNGSPQKHAWNEVLVDGRWVTVDATWDAGYIGKLGFIKSASSKFFDPLPAEFNKTHRVTSYTVN